jgi:hypothetical protein
VVADGGTVNYGSMTDGHAAPDRSRHSEIGMDHDVVLKIRFFADDDSVEFGAENGAEHHDGARSDLDHSVGSGCRSNERR